MNIHTLNEKKIVEKQQRAKMMISSTTIQMHFNYTSNITSYRIIIVYLDGGSKFLSFLSMNANKENFIYFFFNISMF